MRCARLVASGIASYRSLGIRYDFPTNERVVSGSFTGLNRPFRDLAAHSAALAEGSLAAGRADPHHSYARLGNGFESEVSLRLSGPIFPFRSWGDSMVARDSRSRDILGPNVVDHWLIWCLLGG